MDLNETFNNQWQEFEAALISTSRSTDATNFRDALNKLKSSNVYVREHYDQIEDLYALRNVFAHRKRGNYIADIKKHAINELEMLLTNVKTPPTVKDIFGCEVYFASTNDLIENVMAAMTSNIYTHVPVYKEKHFMGVFSYTSFFDWLHYENTHGNREPRFTKKDMGDINRRYLNSPSVNYMFVDQSLNAYEVPIIFENRARKTPHPERLDCIIISDGGHKSDPITGIITSWDLGSLSV